MAYEPSDSDLDDALERSVKVLEGIYDAVTADTDPLVDNVSAILSNVTYPGSAGVRQGAVRSRLGMEAFLLSVGRAMLDPIFAGYLLLAESEFQDPISGHADLLKYFDDNSKDVDGRTLTVGSISDSGTGNPVYQILRHDQYDYPIECVWPETVDVEALVVQPSSNAGEETLRIFNPPRIDIFSLTESEDRGNGAILPYELNNSDGPILRDASFEFNRAAATAGNLTSLGAWKDSDGTNLAKLAVVNDGYRQSVRERALAQLSSSNPTKQCLEIDAAQGDLTGIFQRLPDVDFNTPYHAGVWICRKSSATGDFILTVGNYSITVDISTLTNDVWTFVGFDPTDSTLRSKHWPDNFVTGDDPKFQIETSSLAVGALRIDTAEMETMARYNGLWIHVAPGPTPIGVDYAGSFALSYSSDTVIQRWLHFLYGDTFYLPSTTGTPSITDPS